MVYKKYIIKSGKKYGPYFYESKREGNKIITTYVGRSSEKHLNYSWIFTGATLVLVTLLIFSIFYYSQTTGKVALDIKTSYSEGELITGNLKFNLISGELVPKGSAVSVSYNGLEKSFLISELIDSSAVSGDFFVENSKISGNGEGYGIAGEKITYPEIKFELLITKGIGAEKKTPANEISNESAGSLESGSAGESTNSGNTETETPIAPVIPAGLDSATETPVKEEIKEEKNNEKMPLKEEKEENKEKSKNKELEKSESVEESSGSSSTDAGSSHGFTLVTGEAISENEYIINGKTSKDKEFSYNLAEGESAGIVSRSVKYNKSEIGDENIQLEQVNGIIKVKTSYSITEKGFGKEFLQENKTGLNLIISLDKFNISAIESSKLKISLAYEGKEIVSAEKDINVENSEKKLDNETLVERELNKTIINQSEINQTIFNEANVTLELNTSKISNLSNVTIITLRHKIKVGELVKWTKNVSLIESKEVNIELPKEAENISVKKIEKTSGEEREAIAQVRGITGNIISEKVSTEINLKKDEGFFGWLKGLFRGMTGKAISDFNETEVSAGNNSLIEITLKDNATSYSIEYYTAAPTSIESQTSNGKQIVVSGPDELNYTDVLVSAKLNKNIPQFSVSRIKLYWRNYEYNTTDFVLKKVDEVPNVSIIEENIKEIAQVIVNESSIENNENNGENNTTNETLAESIILNKTTNESVIENNATNLPEANSTEASLTESLFTGNVIEETGRNSIANETIESSENETIQDNETLSSSGAEENVLFDEQGVAYVRESIEFETYDSDSDGLIDEIAWIAPHLSNQTFEIIEIVKAEHLDSNRAFVEDIYDYVNAQDNNWTSIPAGDYVRVVFEQNLTNKNDITIYAKANDCNNVAMINGQEVPCAIYEKKKRLDELRRLMG